MKPNLFLFCKNIEHNCQKTGEFFSKVISWNQFKMYQKQIQIFLKLLKNFPEISQSLLKTCVKLT